MTSVVCPSCGQLNQATDEVDVIECAGCGEPVLAQESVPITKGKRTKSNERRERDADYRRQARAMADELDRREELASANGCAWVAIILAIPLIVFAIGAVIFALASISAR